MNEKVRSVYAIPCLLSADDDENDAFFLTFSTRNEDEAIRLASCVCGKKKAPKTLVIINEFGEIFSLY